MTTKRPVGRPRIYISSQLIATLKEQGLSYRQIALVTGYSYGSIRRAMQQYENSRIRSAG